MELLARFACIFAFGKNKGSPPPSRRRQRSSALHLDGSNLATSSLPTILEQFLLGAAYRKLLDKTLVYQGLLGFACRSLL